MDAPKTGLRIKDDVLKRFKKKFLKRSPIWKEEMDKAKKESSTSKKKDSMSFINEKNVTRPAHLGRFIMDILHVQAKVWGAEQIAAVEHAFQALQLSVDADLAAPWLEMQEISKRVQVQENNDRLKRDLEMISDHVKLMYAEHRHDTKSCSRQFWLLPKAVRQDIFGSLARKFVEAPLPSDLSLSKVSWCLLSFKCIGPGR